MSPYLGVFPRVFSALPGPRGRSQDPRMQPPPTDSPSPPCCAQGGSLRLGRLLTPSESQPRLRAAITATAPGYLNSAFSAPRICTVDAGYLARLVRLPACEMRRAPTWGTAQRGVTGFTGP